jgi:hypothetical protein
MSSTGGAFWVRGTLDAFRLGMMASLRSGMTLDLFCDLLALAVAEESVGLFLLFPLAACSFPDECPLADAFVLPLPLPLIFPLVEAVVTLTLAAGMLSLADAMKAFSGKGPSTLLIGTVLQYN